MKKRNYFDFIKVLFCFVCIWGCIIVFEGLFCFLSNGLYFYVMFLWYDNFLLYVNIYWKYVIENKL